MSDCPSPLSDFFFNAAGNDFFDEQPPLNPSPQKSKQIPEDEGKNALNHFFDYVFSPIGSPFKEKSPENKGKNKRKEKGSLQKIFPEKNFSPVPLESTEFFDAEDIFVENRYSGMKSSKKVLEYEDYDVFKDADNYLSEFNEFKKIVDKREKNKKGNLMLLLPLLICSSSSPSPRGR